MRDASFVFEPHARFVGVLGVMEVHVLEANVAERGHGWNCARRVDDARLDAKDAKHALHRRDARLIRDVELREAPHRAVHQEHVTKKARHHAGRDLVVEREPSAVTDDERRSDVHEDFSGRRDEVTFVALRDDQRVVVHRVATEALRFA